MKRKAAAKVGMNFFLRELPEEIQEEDLLREVETLNNRSDVHGLIVQLPLPEHIDEKRILEAVSYEKDIDGIHPLNIGEDHLQLYPYTSGSLGMKGRSPLFVACTPLACLEIIRHVGVSLSGKQVTVIGRSNIVGLPVSLLCLKSDASVNVCHSFTDLPNEVTRSSDVLIVAVGQPHLVSEMRSNRRSNPIG